MPFIPPRPRLRLRLGIAPLLTLGMVGVVISLVAVTATVEIQRRRAALYQELEHRGQVLAATLVDTLADPLYFLDVDALEDIAQMLHGPHGAADIRVLDSQGRVLVMSSEDGLGHYSVANSFTSEAMRTGQVRSRWQSGALQVAGPVVAGRDVIGGFEFELDTGGVAAEIQGMTRRRMWESLVLSLASGLVAFAVAQTVVRPIRRLVAATHLIGQVEFQASADTRRRDEIGDLNRSFARMAARLKESQAVLEKRAAELQSANQRLEAEMAERQRVEAQFLQSQKMESVGRLAGGVAHDFNNLLTPIMGYAQLGAAQVPQDHPLQPSLEEIGKAARRAANLTRQLLAFSRRQVVEPKEVNLNDLVADMEKMLRRLIGEDLQLTTSADPGLGLVKADPGQLEQVLLNLVVNARDAMPQGGTIALRTANATLDQAQASRHLGAVPGRYAVLSVTDTGTGMTEEVKAHLFEPFFTTKEVGKGTGLGLATCFGIVQQSGGFIDVQTAVGSGTSFRIYLPRLDEEPAGPAVQGQVREGGSLMGHEVVLLAEDEAGVRELATRVLESYGYTVLAAANGEAALQLAQERAGQEIHLLLTDVVMPHMGGMELARRFGGLYPHTPVVFTTGYTDEPVVHKAGSANPVAWIQKPFLPQDLARKVREVLDEVRESA